MERPLSWAAALAQGLALVQKPGPLAALPYLLHAASAEAPHNEQVDAHAALGRIRTGLGQHALAAKHYTAILALRPSQLEARFLLGQAFLSLDWPDLALAHFRALPAPLGGWWRSTAQQAQRLLAAAREDIRQAILVFRQAQPASPDAAEALARALLRAGRLSPAERLLARLPPTPVCHWLAALFTLRRRQGVADDALLAALTPKLDAPSALHRAAAPYLLAIGAVEAAAAVLAEGEPRRSDDALRGRILLAQGRLAELAALGEAGLRRNRDDTDAARRLLSCQVLLGEVPIWRGADLAARAAPPLALVQFWNKADPPADVRAVMDSWVHHHPGLTLARFDAVSARAFILQTQGDKLARGYDTLHNPALQSNMLRLVYLATHGGLWVDADERCLRPMDEVLARLPTIGMVAPYSDQLPYYVHSYMLAAPPGSPVMAALLVGQMRAVRVALSGGPGLQNWVSNGPGLVTRVAARMPGQVALLAPAYWRSFAADADDLAYKSDISSDWRVAPRPPSGG